MQLLNRTFNSLRDKGFSRTFQSVISVIEDFYFEMQYGVSTSRIVKREDLDISERSKEHSEEYKPTRIRHFRLLIKDLKLPDDSVFVDMGSGKGRIILIASLLKFKQVIGVEISSQLCQVARNNVAMFEKKLKRPLHIEIVNEDVLQYSIKADENVFYFYKPFDNFVMENIIQRVLKSVIQNPRKVWLIINNFIPYSTMIENEFKFRAIKKFIYGGTEIAVYAVD